MGRTVDSFAALTFASAQKQKFYGSIVNTKPATNKLCIKYTCCLCVCMYFFHNFQTFFNLFRLHCVERSFLCFRRYNQLKQTNPDFVDTIGICFAVLVLLYTCVFFCLIVLSTTSQTKEKPEIRFGRNKNASIKSIPRVFNAL